VKKFFIRILVLVPIMAFAYLTQKISSLYLTAWVKYEMQDDLVMYARWEGMYLIARKSLGELAE